MNKEAKMTDEKYRNTKQRKRILEVLCSTDTHPTASWIYDQLKPEFPALSLGTVYRNLGILEDQGLLKKIVFGSTFDRYDGKTKPHTHFICTKCGKVYDLEGSEHEELIGSIQQRTRHEVRDLVMSVYGVCEDCLIADTHHIN